MKEEEEEEERRKKKKKEEDERGRRKQQKKEENSLKCDERKLDGLVGVLSIDAYRVSTCLHTEFLLIANLQQKKLRS